MEAKEIEKTLSEAIQLLDVEIPKVTDNDNLCKVLIRLLRVKKQVKSSLGDVGGKDLLNELINNQEEVYAIGGIRWNGLHVEKIKQIFEKHGIKYEQPF